MLNVQYNLNCVVNADRLQPFTCFVLTLYLYCVVNCFCDTDKTVGIMIVLSGEFAWKSMEIKNVI